MKINIIMLVIMVVITIIYLVFSIWNTFISKKQITISGVDYIYGLALCSFVGMYTKNLIMFAITIMAFAIWLMLISVQWKRNYNKKIKAEVF